MGQSGLYSGDIIATRQSTEHPKVHRKHIVLSALQYMVEQNRMHCGHICAEQCKYCTPTLLASNAMEGVDLDW